MRKILKILTAVLFVPFSIFTALIIGFHIYSPFSLYLILYDVLLVLYLFIIPKIWGKKLHTAENGFNEWYGFVGILILVSLGYYIITFVYSL